MTDVPRVSTPKVRSVIFRTSESHNQVGSLQQTNQGDVHVESVRGPEDVSGMHINMAAPTSDGLHMTLVNL
jgi:hypothetical protein